MLFRLVHANAANSCLWTHQKVLAVRQNPNLPRIRPLPISKKISWLCSPYGFSLWILLWIPFWIPFWILLENLIMKFIGMPYVGSTGLKNGAPPVMTTSQCAALGTKNKSKFSDKDSEKHSGKQSEKNNAHFSALTHFSNPR